MTIDLDLRWFKVTLWHWNDHWHWTNLQCSEATRWPWNDLDLWRDNCNDHWPWNDLSWYEVTPLHWKDHWPWNDLHWSADLHITFIIRKWPFALIMTLDLWGNTRPSTLILLLLLLVLLYLIISCVETALQCLWIIKLSQLLLEAYWPNKPLLSSSYPASNCHEASVCRTGLLSKWRAEPGRLKVSRAAQQDSTVVRPQPCYPSQCATPGYSRSIQATPPPVQYNRVFPLEAPLGCMQCNLGRYYPRQYLMTTAPHGDHSRLYTPVSTGDFGGQYCTSAPPSDHSRHYSTAYAPPGGNSGHYSLSTPPGGNAPLYSVAAAPGGMFFLYMLQSPYWVIFRK